MEDVRVAVCPKCGALIAAEQVKKHKKWHSKMKRGYARQQQELWRRTDPRLMGGPF